MTDEVKTKETSAVIPKPRQWLYDRSNGKSQTQKEELGRPFCPLCWPPPCVKCCPDVLEQNACCECFGSIGCFPEDEPLSRVWLMRKSMLLHLAGLIMSILAATAVTSNADLLQTFPFSSGVITGYVGDINVQKVIMKVGLTHVFVTDDYFGPKVHGLDDLCVGSSMGIPLTSVEDCNTCKDASGALVTTVILGVIAYIPTWASNVNRSYYNYDVNCQKVFGTVIAIFNMLMSLYTWNGYAQKCFGTFFNSEVIIPVLVPAGSNITTLVSGEYRPYLEFLQSLNSSWIEANVGLDPSTWDLQEIRETLGFNESLYGNVETEVAVGRVNFDWKPGVGLILCVVATVLKLIDIINHFLIRTPSITRDLQEQLEYEKLYGGDNTDDVDAEDGEKGDKDA